MLSKKHNFFKKFGEIYFSEVHPKNSKVEVSQKRTQIIKVVNGKVRFSKKIK